MLGRLHGDRGIVVLGDDNGRPRPGGELAGLRQQDRRHGQPQHPARLVVVRKRPEDEPGIRQTVGVTLAVPNGRLELLFRQDKLRHPAAPPLDIPDDPVQLPPPRLVVELECNQHALAGGVPYRTSTFAFINAHSDKYCSISRQDRATVESSAVFRWAHTKSQDISLGRRASCRWAIPEMRRSVFVPSAPRGRSRGNATAMARPKAGHCRGIGSTLVGEAPTKRGEHPERARCPFP